MATADVVMKNAAMDIRHVLASLCASFSTM
jgi:hypothetical protein